MMMQYTAVRPSHGLTATMQEFEKRQQAISVSQFGFYQLRVMINYIG
jgi:hypothetical protein